MTPLHSAVANKSNAVAELLIRSGADVNAIDKVSTTLIKSPTRCTCVTPFITMIGLSYSILKGLVIVQEHVLE